MKYMISLLAAVALSASAETTIYFEDGSSVTTDKPVYTSDQKLYTIVEVTPIEAPEADETPTEDPDEVDCNDPRPEFDGTFTSIWAGKAWDAACGD